MEVRVCDKLDAFFTGIHEIIAIPDTTDYKTWLKEGKKIWKFRSILEEVGRCKHLDFVLLTGNSYDLARGRVVENFMLYDIPNVNVVVISENGLVAQSRDSGVYWIGKPDYSYREAADTVEKFAHNNFPGLFWLQGNMIRKTFKPVSGYKGFDEEFVPRIIDFAKYYSIVPFDIEQGFGDEVGVIYHHPGSSIDIDPRKVRIRKGGKETDMDFRGKETAVRLLSEMKNYSSVACMARAESDYPMMKAVDDMGGMTYLPVNHNFSSKELEKLTKEFHIKTADVKDVLPAILKAYVNRQYLV